MSRDWPVMAAVLASEQPASSKKTTADLRRPWNTSRRRRSSIISGLLSSSVHEALKPLRVHGVTGWIVIPLTLAGLSISSLPKYIELWPRAERVGAEAEWWKTVGLSFFNSLAAAVAAFVLGNLVRWLWW
jgi:hypothetical protein